MSWSVAGIAASLRRRRGDDTPILISIDPDWRDDFGHFGAWDQRVNDHCASAEIDFVSLCHDRLEGGPAFARPTFAAGFPRPLAADLGRFEDDLRAALLDITSSRSAVAAMYAGSLHALAAISVLAPEFPNVRFVVNLMRSHRPLQSLEPAGGQESLADAAAILQHAIDQGVQPTVDSVALQTKVARWFHHELDVWPMIWTTPIDLLEPSRGEDESASVRVIAPVQPQWAKGYDLVGKLADHLRPRLEAGDIEFLARYRAGESTDTDRIADAIEQSGGSLIHGDLSLARYGALLASADVVIVPYRGSTFETRTSGVVLDAIAASAAVITTRGTWGGELTARYDIGRVFGDGDASSLADTLDSVLDELPVELERVAAARDDVLTEFAPRTIVDFLLDRRPSGPRSPADTTSLAARRRMSYRAYDG